jgi:acetyltransferase-like isoleucine patch superfamily enzyme
MTIYSFLFRAIRKLSSSLKRGGCQLYAKAILNGNGVRFYNSIKINGIPQIDVHRTASFTIGENCTINSSLSSNPIGRYSPSMFMVRENAILSIGNNVGISSAALICQERITIEDHVKIGGGVCIYDTDFHSLNTGERRHSKSDQVNKKMAPVLIKKNAFIGAHTTILKGVCIGENSIVGACSLVIRSIPANEIWAGSPARFIKKCIDNE